jgi:hypothetical protein
MRHYITEHGVQLLACMSCRFEMVEPPNPSESLDRVRQMAARDQREHGESQKNKKGGV